MGKRIFQIEKQKRKGMRRIASAAMAFCLLAGLTACDKAASGNIRDLMKGIDAETVLAAQKTEEEKMGECGAALDFAVRLLQKSAASDWAENVANNTLISPMSVLYALSMTANGAKGNTLRQMEEVLGLPVEELNQFLYEYRKALPSAEKYQVNLANSIWYAEGIEFEPDSGFLQRNANYYSAKLYSAEFNEDTRAAINRWAKENTDGMIPEIIGRISEHAVMYLVNAVSFDAEWAEIYKDTQVLEGSFSNAAGEKKQVDFMASEERVYLEDAGAATGFMKYYAGERYAFAALLPAAGSSVEDYIESLTGEKLQQIFSGAQKIIVETEIPKFSHSSAYLMNDFLIQMGMEDAFVYETADFTGMGRVSEDRNIYISQVIHKAKIEVDERGTKAGAATVVEMTDGAAYVVDAKSVRLNRPFVYLIVDCETNLPLFLGTVMDVGE